MSEKFPVHNSIDTIRGCTVFKSESWWKAALLYENHGQRNIGVYLWKRTDDGWKRKQKYVIRSPEEWEKDRDLIESFLQELATD